MVSDTALLLFLLLAGHAVADYPLQGAFLAQGKDHTNPANAELWPHALGAHALIHGGFVAALTGSVALGVAETLAHAAIDRAKCSRRLDLTQDQILHLGCKLMWWWLA